MCNFIMKIVCWYFAIVFGMVFFGVIIGAISQILQSAVN